MQIQLTSKGSLYKFREKQLFLLVASFCQRREIAYSLEFYFAERSLPLFITDCGLFLQSVDAKMSSLHEIFSDEAPIDRL